MKRFMLLSMLFCVINLNGQSRIFAIPNNYYKDTGFIKFKQKDFLLNIHPEPRVKELPKAFRLEDLKLAFKNKIHSKNYDFNNLDSMPNAIDSKNYRLEFKGNNGNGFDEYTASLDHMSVMVPDKTNRISMPNALESGNNNFIPRKEGIQPKILKPSPKLIVPLSEIYLVPNGK